MSYNSLIATAVLDMPLQDDAASTVVVNNAGTDGTLVGGDNTADLSTTGPTTWLPKALQFDGTADAVDIGGIVSIADAAAFTIACWIKSPGSGGIAGELLTGDDRIDYDLADRCFVRFGQTRAFQPLDFTADTWHFLAVRRETGGDTYVFLDGLERGPQSTTGPFNPTYLAVSNGAHRNQAQAGVIALSESADIAELYAGPEPSNVSGTLGSDGSLTSDADDPSNGTITYEWVVVEADGTVVDSGTGATGTADFGATTGLLTLLVRASNDGGYDVGDFATRTSGYGSVGDGYYEVATVTAVAADGLYSSIYPNLAGSMY